MIEIFLSRPNWVDSSFREGLDGFLSLLKTLDLNPRTIGTTDYPNQSPLDEVIALMKECKGAIILGYPQIYIKTGTLKSKEIKDTIALPTEWNHIEASLAYAQGLPLLLIHHLGVSRGVFDKGATNKFIYEKDLSNAAWAVSKEIAGAIKKWKTDVLSNRTTIVSSLDVKSEQPKCPNCSTSTNNIYLSPFPKDFIGFENVTHECSKCGYKYAPEQKLRYEAPYYWRDNESGKDGPFCQACYDSDAKEIRLQGRGNGSWNCSICKTNYLDSSYREPDISKLHSDFNPFG